MCNNGKDRASIITRDCLLLYTRIAFPHSRSPSIYRRTCDDADGFPKKRARNRAFFSISRKYTRRPWTVIAGRGRRGALKENSTSRFTVLSIVYCVFR